MRISLTLRLVLLVLALICFILAAIGVNGGRLNLVATGLALWVAAELFG